MVLSFSIFSFQLFCEGWCAGPARHPPFNCLQIIQKFLFQTWSISGLSAFASLPDDRSRSFVLPISFINRIQLQYSSQIGSRASMTFLYRAYFLSYSANFSGFGSAVYIMSTMDSDADWKESKVPVAIPAQMAEPKAPSSWLQATSIGT